MRGQAFIAAAAVAAALVVAAQPAAAQQYRSYHDEHVANQQACQQSRNNRTLTGVIIGGIAGAVLGREVADRGVRGEGALLGAVVGATAGGAIGRNTADCRDVPEGSYDPYSGRPYPGAPYDGDEDPYYQGGDDDDLAGGPYNQSGYRGGGDDCRWGELRTVDRRGRERSEQVWMCRDRDGVWRPA